MALGQTLRRFGRALGPVGALVARVVRGRPRRLALWTLAIGFFVFALGYPLLYVFEEAFRIPPPRHSVGPEQSLYEFAAEHETSVADLRAWNGLAPDEEVEPGRVLDVGPNRWGLAHFVNLVLDPTSRGWLANSLGLGFVVTVITFLIAMPLAWFSVKRDFPGKALLGLLILVPMILPPFVGAIGMRRMLARFGSVNLLLSGLGLTDTPIDFLGAGRFWGVALFEALHLYPIMYLNLTAALANVDPSLEEAASTLGDSGIGRFRRVTFPLMLPGVFAGCSIVFVWAFTDLGTPLVFQFQQVVSKRIFDQAMSVNPQGSALVIVVLLITAALFVLGRRLAKRRPVTSATKGSVVAAPVKAGPWERRLAWALFGGVAFVALLPHLGVMLEAFSNRWFMSVMPEEYTLANVTNALSHPIATASVRNSLLLSIASTAVNIVLGIAIAVFVVRSGSRWAPLADTLAMLPLAIPGIVLAFGYVGAYSGAGPWLSPRENPVILLVASYALRRLPYVVRACVAGLEQTPRHLEEASASLGATPGFTLRRITLPLIGAHLIAGGILAFSFAMLEVSDSLILAAKEQYYPITKAIYHLNGRLSDGPGIACALGLFGVLLLATSLWAASTLVGRRLGEMFRAG